MNSDQLIAKNEVEKQLAALQSGEMNESDFMHQLFNSELFMPIQDEKSGVDNLQISANAVPLTLTAEDGSNVLILFTSPERARGFLQSHPGYGGGLLAEFKWILEKVGSGFNISINPDSELGLDLEAGMLDQITE